MQARRKRSALDGGGGGTSQLALLRWPLAAGLAATGLTCMLLFALLDDRSLTEGVWDHPGTISGRTSADRRSLKGVVPWHSPHTRRFSAKHGGSNRVTREAD